jgi:hypothetical protein
VTATIRVKYVRLKADMKAVGRRCVTNMHCCPVLTPAQPCGNPGAATINLPATLYATVAGLSGAGSYGSWPHLDLALPGPPFFVLGSGLQNKTYTLSPNGAFSYSTTEDPTALSIGVSNALYVGRKTVNLPAEWKTDTGLPVGGAGPQIVDTWVSLTVAFGCPTSVACPSDVAAYVSALTYLAAVPPPGPPPGFLFGIVFADCLAGEACVDATNTFAMDVPGTVPSYCGAPVVTLSD